MTPYQLTVMRVTSPYGIQRSNGRHNGVDVKAGTSGTLDNQPVVAVVNAYIEYTSTGWNYGRGTNAILKWIEDGVTYRLRYQHLAKLNVKTGDVVEPGAVIGIEGFTGSVDPEGKSGTHTHFELTVGGTLKSYGEVAGATILNPCPILNIKNVKGVYPVITLETDSLPKVLVEYASIGDTNHLIEMANEMNVPCVIEDYKGDIVAPEGNKLSTLLIGGVSAGDEAAIVAYCNEAGLNYKIV